MAKKLQLTGRATGYDLLSMPSPCRGLSAAVLIAVQDAAAGLSLILHLARRDRQASSTASRPWLARGPCSTAPCSCRLLWRERNAWRRRGRHTGLRWRSGLPREMRVSFWSVPFFSPPTFDLSARLRLPPLANRLLISANRAQSGNGRDGCLGPAPANLASLSSLRVCWRTPGITGTTGENPRRESV